MLQLCLLYILKDKGKTGGKDKYKIYNIYI